MSPYVDLIVIVLVVGTTGADPPGTDASPLANVAPLATITFPASAS